ncbi:hypothetical protein [Nocardioides donggukensis]|uniref:Uncharacterized protein n=1 Tax=Nocardioides donggukensis TaxID=2774019 RepID=A0A927K1R2_9ACTN|nr:hypothetical protein [Nocardioides donggukensis]MBD8868042.1 hypothetical protein [Nocardioides donggukensis]
MATAIVMLGLASCTRGDGGVVEAGDRLTPPADWVERRELVVEESLFCGGPAPCPHLEREWDIAGQVTVATVEKVFADLGSPTVDETAPGCIDMSQCRFTFSDGEFRWELAIVHDLPDLPDGAGLHVQLAE